MESNSLESAFKEAEASLRLEGMDVASNVHYQDVKKRVLDGELTFEAARHEIMERYRKGKGNVA